MIEHIPTQVQHGVLEMLQHRLNRTPIKLTDFTFIHGGCINQGGRLSTNTGLYFLKWNFAKQLPGMFAAEEAGLTKLRNAQVIDIPQVWGSGVAGDYQFLLLEFRESCKKATNFGQVLGHQLAALHVQSAPQFGLDHNNYIGSLPQSNKRHTTWIDFFVEERLQPQLDLALRAGLISTSLQNNMELLYTKLADLLPAEKPALVHGDLWQGNVIVNSKGEPCLIDPAVHFGHREADVAMTLLFGGFNKNFYSAYQEAFPMVSGFTERSEVYNLFPLLVHVNLFGRSYVRQVEEIVLRFTA